MACCGGCADLMLFSTYLCKKKKKKEKEKKKEKHFHQELRDLGVFLFYSILFCFVYSNLGLPMAKSLQNGRLSFLLGRRKIEPVTTHKMASHLMDMNIIFQENTCLTDLNHYKRSKMTIFWVRFNIEKNRHCIVACNLHN